MTDDISKVVREMREAQEAYAGHHSSGTFRRLADRLESPAPAGITIAENRMILGGVAVVTVNGKPQAIITTPAATIKPCRCHTAEARRLCPDKRECSVVEAQATTPAEVDVPTIDRDEPFQRDYIPLGRSGWEIQTKGKGSTYRLCEPDGHRLAIPNEPYLHETLTRMARDVHADYATLARQLAEAKERIESLTTANELLTASVESRGARYQQAESQLAEATRRLGEVEGLPAVWEKGMGAEHRRICANQLRAAPTKEPTK